MTLPSGASPVDRQQRGRIGERVAVALLRRSGYAILEQNVRCGRVELDVVAREGPVLVFVEVKARWGDAFGAPQDAITPAKRRNLLSAAGQYLRSRQLDDLEWRVDVLALTLRGTDVLHWELFRDALEGD
ncbi:MAG TPA: YraN family protein [Chloroflexota bacterium]|nr:YraN family protein [Chloroflexota bacterium]